MDNVPAPVQVLIDWFILLISTIVTFFKRLNGGEEETTTEPTSVNE